MQDTNSLYITINQLHISWIILQSHLFKCSSKILMIFAQLSSHLCQVQTNRKNIFLKYPIPILEWSNSARKSIKKLGLNLFEEYSAQIFSNRGLPCSKKIGCNFVSSLKIFDPKLTRPKLFNASELGDLRVFRAFGACFI